MPSESPKPFGLIFSNLLLKFPLLPWKFLQTLSAEDDAAIWVSSRSGFDSLTTHMQERERADRTVTTPEIQQNWFTDKVKRNRERSVQPELDSVSEALVRKWR